MIELHEVEKIYNENGAAPVKALDNVSLEIHPGELVAIMGPSGSGKSTLLNLIGLLDRQTRGGYKLNGKAVNSLHAQERARLRNSVFGFVLQDFAVLGHYTVYQNVKIPLSYTKTKTKEIKERVLNILKQLHIDDKMDIPADHLSGGQKQRVAIARALVNNPEILLADEPTGALDQKTGMEVLKLLLQINKEGKTVIIVTHDRNVALQCHKIIHLLDGKIENIETITQEVQENS